MPQSLANIYIHIVFSTKNRKAFLADKDIRDQMHAYLGSVLKGYDSPAVAVGGTDDHVHILCNLSRTETLAKVIGETKRTSSKWIKTKGKGFGNFQWQNGYGAFSVSRSRLEEARRYIVNQDQHHKKMTFQEEFRALLKKQGIEFDERYVWD